MRIRNLTKGDNIEVVKQAGPFKIIEHLKDLSVSGATDALAASYMSKMNVRKRQIVCTVTPNLGIILSSGAMQFMAGQVSLRTNIKGAGDFIKKAITAKVTGESVIKPHYTGQGLVVTEPTFMHLHVLDLVDYPEGLVLNDSIFEACSDDVELKAVMVKTLSGAVLGSEGLFNLGVFGQGFVIIELNSPFEELVEIEIIRGESIQIDGPYALMWTPGLNLSVERSSKTLIGSAATGEGLVNVYKGEGTLYAKFTDQMRGHIGLRQA